MAHNNTKKGSDHSLIKKSGLIITGVFLLYTIAGFLVVPPLLKPRIEKELSSQIGRKVTIEKIKINPLALSATAINLTVYETTGEPFAGFKELLVNAELSSILRWALTFKEIRMRAPFVVLQVLPDQTLNISDIITRFTKTDPAPEGHDELPRAFISKLQVEEGRCTVEDYAVSEPVIETFSPIAFSLTNLSTLAEREGAFKFAGISPHGGNFQVDGQLSVNPVRIQGSFSTTGTNLNKLWKHIEEQVSFEIKQGTTDISGNYFLELKGGTLQARLQEGVFALKDFQLTEKNTDEKLISIKSFSVQGVSADVAEREIVIEQVKTADAMIESWLEPDGTLKLQSLLAQDLQKLEGTGKPDPTEPETDAVSPWHATIHKIEMDNWNAAIEDRTLPEPARITFDDVRLRIENLGNQKDSKGQVTVVFQLNKMGTVKLNGSAGINPLSADFEIFSDKISLKSFQPYVDTALNAQIASGTTSSKGHMVYQGKNGQPQISYQGELSLDDMEVQDRIQTEDFIRQEQLKASGILLDIQPNRLHVADVLINKTYANITIDKNGTVNVVQAFTPFQKKGENEKENLLERLVNFLVLQIEGPMPMDIDLINLDDFAVDFIDKSIKPSYTTHLQISKGTMKGLSSDLAARADFKIDGLIDKSAIIESGGQMNPLNAMQYTQVDFLLKDFDLRPVSPYSGKYIGYKIAEGTLHLDLKYRVDNNSVTGDNRIMINRLTLGDKVKSPDATHLPVALGVALLKDANGRISLQVPVEGNVEQPQFNFGQAIISGLTGTMDNVVSSPFSTITAIDGFEGEELAFVEFEYGRAELSEHAKKKLDALAKFLNGRSALILGIEGTADREMDWAVMSGKPAPKEKPGSKENAAQQQTKELSKDQAVDDNQLQMLAENRAKSVNEYLVEKGKVDVKRMQFKDVKINSTTQKEYGRVEFYLSAQ